MAALMVLGAGGAAAQVVVGDEAVGVEIEKLVPKLHEPQESREHTLSNGLRIVTRVHDNGSGEVTFWLRVEAGSAYEQNHERGAAHVAEHLALTGPAKGQPGHAAAAALGIAIGDKRNAYTNVDHAAFWVTTDGTQIQIHRAAMALATVLSPQPATGEMIDAERAVVIDEWEMAASPQSRAQRRLMSGLFPDTALDSRWPEVEPGEVSGLTPDQINAFRERVYTPSAATLIVVGPIEHEKIVGLVTKAMGPLKKQAPATQFGRGAAVTEGLRTVRAEQEGLTETEITIAWPGRTNREGWVAESLAVQVLRDRAKKRVSESEDWAGSELVVLDLTLPAAADPGKPLSEGRLRLVQIGASFPPAEASRGLGTLAAAVSGVAREPVTEDELFKAGETLRSRYERAAKREQFRSAASIASSISRRLPGEVRESASRRAEVVRVALEELTPDRVTQAARTMFDPENAVLVVQGPPGKLPPSSGLLAQYRLGVATVPRAEIMKGGNGGGVVRFFVEPPMPTRVKRVSLDDRAGVFDVVYDNGVRLRHKEMPSRSGEVILRVTIGRALAHDPDGSFGLTRAAFDSLAARPATQASPEGEISSLLERLGISLEISVADGTVDLIVKTPPESIREAASLVGALLSEPSVSGTDLRQWQARSLAEQKQVKSDPARRALQLLNRMLEPGPGSRRTVHMQDTVNRLVAMVDLMPDDANRRVLRAVEQSPVVCSVVGPIGREVAVDEIARAMSGLSPGDELKAWPELLAMDPKSVRVRTTEAGSLGAVAMAWSIERELPIRELRELVAATEILDDRLGRVEGLGGFGHRYASATIAFDSVQPERVSMLVLFTAEPDEVEEVVARVGKVLREFAAHGPTSEELEHARERAVKMATGALERPEFWSRRLASGGVSGESLEGVLSISRDYAGVTAVRCRERVSEALEGEPLSVVVLPAED